MRSLALIVTALSVAAARARRTATPSRGTRVWWAAPGADIPLQLIVWIEAQEGQAWAPSPRPVE